MKLVKFGAIALAALLAAAGCNTKTDRPQTTSTSKGDASTSPSGSDAAKRERALVRFVNADSEHPVVDLWFGDTKAFSNVTYKSVTPYTEVPAERASFKLRPPGDGNDLATNSEGLNAGRRYTIVSVHKPDGSVTLNAVGDDLDPLAPGKAKIRVINAAPAAGDIDLVPAAKKDKEIFDAVNFNSATSFREVEPGRLEIRRDNPKDTSKPVPAQIASLNVQPGKFYTVVVTGDRTVDTIRIEDQEAGQTRAAE